MSTRAGNLATAKVRQKWRTYKSLMKHLHFHEFRKFAKTCRYWSIHTVVRKIPVQILNVKRRYPHILKTTLLECQRREWCKLQLLHQISTKLMKSLAQIINSINSQAIRRQISVYSKWVIAILILNPCTYPWKSKVGVQWPRYARMQIHTMSTELWGFLWTGEWVLAACCGSCFCHPSIKHFSILNKLQNMIWQLWFVEAHIVHH